MANTTAAVARAGISFNRALIRVEEPARFRELVERIAFGTADHVKVFTKDDMIMDLAYEGWGSTQKGITCTKCGRNS